MGAPIPVAFHCKLGWKVPAYQILELMPCEDIDWPPYVTWQFRPAKSLVHVEV